MQFDNLHFSEVLIFITIVLIFSIFFYAFYKKREKLKKKYVLLFDQNNIFYIKYLFLLGAFIILLFSIFKPVYLSENIESEKNWIDIVFVLDVSKSMNALDYINSWKQISRLDFSKNLIWNYVVNNPENRYWLVIFAWEAVSSLPLTTDNSIFLSLLSWVDYRNLNEQWTNLSEAIEFWYDRLLSSSEDRSKAIFLLSDWADDDLKLDFSDKVLENYDIENIIIWIWSKNWAKIPKNIDLFWRVSYEKYNWEDVVTKLNNSALKKIASILDWEYLEFDDVNDLWDIEKILSNLEKKAINIWDITNKKDLSRILSILSMILFLIYLILNFNPSLLRSTSLEKGRNMKSK